METPLPDDWHGAAWIGEQTDLIAEVLGPPTDDRPFATWGLRASPYLRRRFHLAGSGAGTLSITALGLYECWINGRRVGDQVLAPGWTDYRIRLHVQRFDVSEYLAPGPNVIAVVLADGWYSGFVGFDRGRQARLWGERPRCLVDLAIAQSGEPTRIVSDSSWRYSTGEIIYADLLMGEMRDARTEPAGWKESGFDDSGWLAVRTDPLQPDSPVLTDSPAPAIRITERLGPISLTQVDAATWQADFGQNLVGAISLTLRGQPAGTQLIIRHAEMLAPDARLYVDNLRTALAQDSYITRGGEVELFEPAFTVHGFRFAEISGLTTRPELADISARVIGSDVDRIGSFECSRPDINRLHQNIRWTLRGNLMDLPTDCPQRDERLGWLADAQLISPTASFLFDLGGFFAKWMQDVADAQGPDGSVPDVAPRVAVARDGAPGWADAIVLIPWQTYVQHGDLGILQRHFDDMRRWLDHVLGANPTLIRRNALNSNYGDWLHLAAPTDKNLLASAYLALCVETMSHAAGALGRSAEQRDYRQLWDQVRSAFTAEFVSGNGTVAGESQTAYAMALHLDLVPDECRQLAALRLVEDISARGGLSTGIHGTRFLCPALSDTGHADVAYRLLLSDRQPSWLAGVRAGATTIWERWDGWTEASGFQTPTMNSFNHFALGSVAEWLHSYSAGISPIASRPAYGHSVLRPYPDPRLSWVAASRRTAGGELGVRWALADGRLELAVSVAPGSTMTVHVPTASDAGLTGWRTSELGPGRHRFSEPFDAGWSAPPMLPPTRLRA